MMSHKFLRSFHIAILLVLASIGAQPARALENPAIRSALGHFMDGYTARLARRLGPDVRIEYGTTALDNRLNVTACPAPLSLNARDPDRAVNRVNVQVSCGAQWSLSLPVDLSIFRPVVTATRPLAPGTTIAASDVQLTEVDVSRLIGQYLNTMDDAVGMDVKRPLAPGRPVLGSQLEPPLLIRRGEAVQIVAEGSVIAVKMPGIALTDGRRGQQIRIRNKASSRVIEARVTGPGEAAVAM